MDTSNGNATDRRTLLRRASAHLLKATASTSSEESSPAEDVPSTTKPEKTQILAKRGLLFFGVLFLAGFIYSAFFSPAPKTEKVSGPIISIESLQQRPHALEESENSNETESQETSIKPTKISKDLPAELVETSKRSTSENLLQELNSSAKTVSQDNLFQILQDDSPIEDSTEELVTKLPKTTSPLSEMAELETSTSESSRKKSRLSFENSQKQLETLSQEATFTSDEKQLVLSQLQLLQSNNVETRESLAELKLENRELRQKVLNTQTDVTSLQGQLEETQRQHRKLQQQLETLLKADVETFSKKSSTPTLHFLSKNRVEIENTVYRVGDPLTIKNETYIILKIDREAGIYVQDKLGNRFKLKSEAN